MSLNDKERRLLGLPDIEIMFTLEQIQLFLNLTPSEKASVIFYDGRGLGIANRRQGLLAINIAYDPEAKPIWRVSETELARWMKHHGIRRPMRNTT